MMHCLCLYSGTTGLARGFDSYCSWLMLKPEEVLILELFIAVLLTTRASRGRYWMFLHWFSAFKSDSMLFSKIIESVFNIYQCKCANSSTKILPLMGCDKYLMSITNPKSATRVPRSPLSSVHNKR